MTNPPPPGNWGPPQPDPQQPYGQGHPQYGPPGQWPPQQNWGPPQAPKNNSLKWLLIGVAALLVIAITVGATLLFTRGGDNGATQTADGTSTAPADFASANDSGPVRVITEEPTCAAAQSVLDSLGEQQRQGWTDRDYALPASSWTPDVRAMYQTAAAAMVRASDQISPLVRKTPHRVIRELYITAILYWRAYADTLDTYETRDNHLILVASNAANTVLSICTTIDYGVAEKRGLLVPDSPPPGSTAPVVDADKVERFVTSDDRAMCARWVEASEQFDLDSEAWRSSDVNRSASEWPSEQRTMMNSQGQIMADFADEAQKLGQESENSILADFAALTAQYWRAFVESIPTYSTADSYLAAAGGHADSIITNACATIAS